MSPHARAQSENQPLPLLDLRALQAFVAIAEGATFSEAAKRLHVGRPNVSKLIQGLEQTLGCRLLTRGPTGSEPTDSGNAALEPARGVLAALHTLAASLAPGTQEAWTGRSCPGASRSTHEIHHARSVTARG